MQQFTAPSQFKSIAKRDVIANVCNLSKNQFAKNRKGLDICIEMICGDGR